MDREEKISFLLEILSIPQRLLYWRFDPNFSLVSTTCINEETLLKIVFGRPEHQAGILAYAKNNDSPLVSSIALGLVWVSVFEKEEGQLKYIHVIGPVYLSDISIDKIEAELNKHYIPNRFRRKLISQLSALPIVTSARFFAFAQRLHYCITGEKISFVDIHHHTPDASGLILEDPTTSGDFHRGIYAAELELFKMIEEGNFTYQNALDKAVSIASGGKIDVRGDPLRKSEVLSITFITLSVRAALRGGLPPATAYSLGDHYLSICLQSTSLSERTSILHTMFQDFVARVHKYRTLANISKPVQTCCDYIDMHPYEETSLDTLSVVAGYTPYYLTRKFKKELGISIWDYINRIKIERAKILLANQGYTIEYISDMLNFCSRSYFCEIFQKHEGISPSVYRKEKLGF